MFKKVLNGDYYFYKKNRKDTVFTVRGIVGRDGEYGYVCLGATYTPKELIGKRVRMKLEIIERSNTPNPRNVSEGEDENN